MNLPYAPDAFAESVLCADDIDFPFDDWSFDDPDPLPELVALTSLGAADGDDFDR